MHTISNEVGGGRRRRREHSAEFKAQVVAACSVPGVSNAAVAMAHGVNPNLARRWVRKAELRVGGVLVKPTNGSVPAPSCPCNYRLRRLRRPCPVTSASNCTAAPLRSA